MVQMGLFLKKLKFPIYVKILSYYFKNDIKEIIECTPSSSKKNRVKILGTNDGTELKYTS
jgi:hypothetical protein